MQMKTHVMFQSGVAKDAARHYVSLVPGAEVLAERDDGQVLVRLAGHELILFDSPVAHDFDLTPSMSLFLEVDEPGQVDDLVAGLAEGGQVLMPVGAYPFSPRFGWCVDRFGVSWQIALVPAGS